MLGLGLQQDERGTMGTAKSAEGTAKGARETAENVERPLGSGGAIPSLTGVRGAAALWVFGTHAQPVLASYLHAPAIGRSTVLAEGFRGVDLFFVLSGFILMYAHAGEFRTLRRRPVTRFYAQRLLRVYPLNTAVLMALVPLVLALPGFVEWSRSDHGVPIPWHEREFSGGGLVQTLLLAQTWTVAKLGEWNGPSWSLSAEVFGYAAFPLLAWAASRCRSGTLALGAAASSLVALLLLLVRFHHATDNPTGTFGLVRMVFCFAAGIALARGRALLPRAGRLAGAVTLAALAEVALALALPGLAALTTFGLAGLIWGLSYRRGPVDGLLCSRPALFLGRISFSFYLVHYVPLHLASWAYGPPVAGAGLAVRLACLVLLGAGCLGLALLFHHGIEVPMQRLARTLHGRKAARPAVGLA